MFERLCNIKSLSSQAQSYALAYRGEAYRLLDLAAKALIDFNRALAFEDTNAWILERRGVTHGQMRNYAQALIDFDRAIALNNKSTRAFLGRGESYLFLRRYERALNDFDQAIALNNRHAWAFILRGRTYRMMRGYEDALKDLHHAIELDEELEHVGRKEIGLVYQSWRKYQDAIEAFRRALLAAPACEECWTSLAKSYGALHPQGEVPRLLREVSIPSADAASVLACRAEAMRKTWHLQEALEDFDAAIALNGSLINQFAINRGLLLSELGRYSDAIESYAQASQEIPSNYLSAYNIAIAVARWKGVNEARTQIDTSRTQLQAMLNTGGRGSALYGLGGLEAVSGNNEQAMKYLELAMQLEKKSVDWARHDVAWLDLRMNPQFQSLIAEKDSL